MEKLCAIDRIQFSNRPFKYELVLEVQASDLVDHAGIIRLIRNALDFRRADGIVVMAGPERIAVRLGELAYVRTITREVEETDGPVTKAFLALLEERGLPLRESGNSRGAGRSFLNRRDKRLLSSVLRSKGDMRKRGRSEAVVDHLPMFNGYFTTHNVRFGPESNTPASSR